MSVLLPRIFLTLWIKIVHSGEFIMHCYSSGLFYPTNVKSNSQLCVTII